MALFISSPLQFFPSSSGTISITTDEYLHTYLTFKRLCGLLNYQGMFGRYTSCQERVQSRPLRTVSVFSAPHSLDISALLVPWGDTPLLS